MNQYTFKTCWTFEAPLEKIWDAIHDMDDWPAWWKYVESVEKVRPGTDGDIGSIRLVRWRTALPYSLAFRSELTAIERHRRMEGITFGDLEGKGIWTFEFREGNTVVKYDWKVRTTKKWMNFLAPIARPFFNWNHDKVMQAGYEGLKKKVLPNQ